MSRPFVKATTTRSQEPPRGGFGDWRWDELPAAFSAVLVFVAVKLMSRRYVPGRHRRSTTTEHHDWVAGAVSGSWRIAVRPPCKHSQHGATATRTESPRPRGAQMLPQHATPPHATPSTFPATRGATTRALASPQHEAASGGASALWEAAVQPVSHKFLPY